MSRSHRRLAGLDESSRAVVDDDRPCTGCGHPLRGCREGGACPECGTRIAVAGEVVDPLLRLGPEERGRVRLGTGLLAVAMLVAGVLPILLLATAIFVIHLGGLGSIAGLRLLSHGTAVVLGGLWTAGVWLALPAAARAAAGGLPRAARPAMGLAAAGWTIGWAVMLVGLLGRGDASAAPPVWLEAMTWPVPALRVLGGLSAAGVLLLLARLAERAELEPGADRIATAAWVLPPLGLLMWVLPNEMTLMGFLLHAVLVLAPWTLVAVLAALGLRSIGRHLAWTARHAREAAGRAERIAARRAEMDAELRARVRPLPGAGGGPASPGGKHRP